MLRKDATRAGQDEWEQPSTMNSKTTKPTSYTKTSTSQQNTKSRKAVTTQGQGSYWIVAVCDGRSGPHSEIGMAGVDLRTSEVFLGQHADSQSFAKTLHRICGLGASEILMPTSSLEPSPSKLARILLEQLPDVEVMPVNRRYFNDVDGLKFVRQFGLGKDEHGLEGEASIVVGLNSKYYALAACNALMWYVDNAHHLTFSPKSIKFRWKTLEGTMLIGMCVKKEINSEKMQ
jgi:DNA mismatch repair protein MSH4